MQIKGVVESAAWQPKLSYRMAPIPGGARAMKSSKMKSGKSDRDDDKDDDGDDTIQLQR